MDFGRLMLRCRYRPLKVIVGIVEFMIQHHGADDCIVFDRNEKFPVLNGILQKIRCWIYILLPADTVIPDRIDHIPLEGSDIRILSGLCRSDVHIFHHCSQYNRMYGNPARIMPGFRPSGTNDACGMVKSKKYEE